MNNKNNKIRIKGSSVISKIKNIRSKNNNNWMAILQLAYKHAPNETRKILKKINSHDKKISKYINSL
tara:strand:- start:234 stop:434 length:201 start_codon:yes stop_codon:yes gene_type:complete